MKGGSNKRYGLFETTGSISPGRSMFDLSYEKKLTCDMGQLIPIMCDEVVPGDVFEIGNEAVVRFQPLIAPIMHEINLYVHYFFVPYRLLWSSWESYITGGVDGADASVLPLWDPTTYNEGSLWDFLGLPVAIKPTGFLPVAFPKYAYNFIYNNYYRDETLITPLDITVNEAILKRAWEKDYFTSALLWQQRGTAPALPISGSTNAVFASDIDTFSYLNSGLGSAGKRLQNSETGGGVTSSIRKQDGSTFTAAEDIKTRVLKTLLDNNTVNFGAATTFNVSDLRLAFQVQRWMERNARAGARYTEFLRAHYGVSPRDERLQRPEYIGGSKNPVIISEVLQTSKTDVSPQGNMAGHGISVGRNYCAKYHAEEFGLIMGIMSVMPRSGYTQGVDRQWIKKTKYDFYSPEFANLSEQAIYRGELYASGVSGENNTVFGYQGRFDEMRFKRSMAVSQMRGSLAYWNLMRQFASAPALNQTFIEMDGTTASAKRCFSAGTAAPGLIVNILNRIKAARPLPISAEPGLIDHD